LTGLDQHLNGKRLYRFGDADAQNIRFLSNISIDFDDFVFYTYGYINHRTGESSGYYRLPSQPRTLIKVYPDGFLPLIKPQIIEFNTVSGIKSNFSGWNSDFAFNYGKNIFQFNVSNSINSSLGPNSPKEFYCGTLQYSHFIFTSDFNKPIDIGFYIPANIAFGTVYTTENFMIIKGDEASYIDGNYIDTINGQIRKYPPGTQVFPGFMPNNETDKYKNNYSLYFDFEQKILENLLIGIALRYENYNDFGERLNKKFAIRYEPISNFAIRSSISTGFKAPTLQQSYFTATTTNLIDGELYQVGTFSVNHPVAQALGAKPLKPEKSNHFNVGIYSLQIPNTSISIDFFNTTVKDRIIISGNFSNNPAKSSPYVINLLNHNKISGAKFFTNAVDTRTYGIDLSFKNEFNFNEDTKLLSSLSYSFFKTKILGNIKIPEQINDSTSKKIFFNRLEITRLIKAQPSNNIYNNFVFTYKNFSIHTNLIKYGDIEYIFDVDNPALDKKFNGKFLIDLTFKYQLQNLIISLGSNNLTNSYPDKKPVEPYLPYFDCSPFGFNGRTIFTKISYKL